MKIRNFIFILAFLFYSAEASADIIVNEHSPVSSLTKDEMFQIFLFYQKFWQNGQKITVILPPTESLLFKRLSSELQVSSTSYSTNVVDKIKAGNQQVVVTNTELEVLIKVANTSNSIGFYYDGVRVNNGFGISVVPVR